MPTLNGLLTWVQREGLNAVWIILVGFAVKFLFKQEWGKGIGFLAAGGVVAFVVNNPTIVSRGFEEVSRLLFQ